MLSDEKIFPEAFSFALPGAVLPMPTLPVVTTFWLPKSGEIFVPDIAADEEMSELSIVPAAMWVVLTAPAEMSPAAIVPFAILAEVMASSAISAEPISPAVCGQRKFQDRHRDDIAFLKTGCC